MRAAQYGTPLKTIMKISNLLLSIFIAFYSNIALSAVKLGSIDPSRQVTLPNWANNGAVTFTVSFCAYSVNNSGVATNYQIKVGNQSGGNPSAFLLKSVGGAPDIPVSWALKDLTNNSTENLIPDTYTALNKTGSSSIQCTNTGDNAALVLSISEAALQAAQSGSYQTRFDVEMLGGQNSAESRRVFIRINFAISPMILISGLNNLLFPLFSGTDISTSDDLCIYRNTPGDYRITSTGSGPAGVFTLSNGVATLPYTATWNDRNSTTALTANGTLTTRRNSTQLSTDCNFGANNNATIALTITAANINGKPQGIYTGILTLIVAPE